MKLRIRVKEPVKKTVVVEVNSVLEHKPVLQDLIEAALNALGSGLQREDLVLSLNGTSPLEGDNVPLSDLGIVNGDLIIAKVDRNHTVEVVPARVEPPLKDGVNAYKVVPCVHQGIVPQREMSSSKEDEKGCRDPVKGHKNGAEPEVMDTDNNTEASTSGYAACNIDLVDSLDEKQVNSYLQEAVLIRDSSCDGSNVPYSLLHLLRNVDAQSIHDMMFVVLHVLMQETGFILIRGTDEDLYLPSGWRSASMYKLTYSYQGIESTGFTLVGVPMAGTMIIHGTVHSEGEITKYQMKVKPAENVYIGAEGPIFKQLPRLSREFKDKVSYAMLQCATKATLLAVPSLNSLFYELKLMILQNLDAASLLMLSQTCSDNKEICHTPSLWYRLFIKNFGKRRAVSDDTSQDWLRLYKDQYTMRQRQREHMKRITMVVPPFMDQRVPPFARPPPWVPPFGIGGDYDRDPGIPHPLQPGRGGMFPMGPRFDPIGPLPGQLYRPGRGGGMRDAQGIRRPNRSMFGGGPPMF